MVVNVEVMKFKHAQTALVLKVKVVKFKQRTIMLMLIVKLKVMQVKQVVALLVPSVEVVKLMRAHTFQEVIHCQSGAIQTSNDSPGGQVMLHNVE